MNDAEKTYRQLIDNLRQIATLSSVTALLQWDEETQMPPKGAELRATQISMLARMVHERFTSPEIGKMLGEVEASGLVRDPESDPAVNAREVRRSYDRATKIPASLVEEQTRTAVLAHQAWVEARKKSEFPVFVPWLKKTIDLKQQEAKCVGYTGHMYNALLDEYEPGQTAEALRPVLEQLRKDLVDLIGRIVSSGKRAPIEILQRLYPAAVQEKLAREASVLIGFDYEAGRLDTSVHPFCSGIGPGDCRMTTRYDEHWFGDAFFGVLHETGHGLYDQGLPKEHWGTPRGDFISLGIHESQSRMWENLVGRGRAFWRFFYPKLRAAVPQSLGDVSEEQFIFAVNDVRPSFIRTEADEATYNLHILLRFEIEQPMLAGELKVEEIPSVWNGKMREYLTITPANDAQGCLQDVHWSHGMIGYFPTYTLGNLYAAQFFEQAKKDVPGLEEQFARGQFGGLLSWLREKIHSQGKKYRARELVKRVTGREPSAEPLMRHLREKAAEWYGV